MLTIVLYLILVRFLSYLSFFYLVFMRFAFHFDFNLLLRLLSFLLTGIIVIIQRLR
jgi:hypothetical protein